MIERKESGKDWKLVHEYIVNKENNYLNLDCSKNFTCTKKNIDELNQIDGFSNYELFTEVKTTNNNVVEPMSFGWIDGDYSDKSYFKPNNDSEIKEKIEEMVYSEENIKKAISYGLSRCDFFSWANCANKTLEVYKKIL